MKKGTLKIFFKINREAPMTEARIFTKKEALAQVISCEFWKISKNNFFTEHLWTTASRVNAQHVNFLHYLSSVFKGKNTLFLYQHNIYKHI